MAELSLLAEATLVMALLYMITVKVGFLNSSGIAAGLVIGFPTYVLGGRQFFFPLLAFYLVTGVLTKYKHMDKRAKGAAEGKLGERGWKNVFSNGGYAIPLALMSYMNPWGLGAYAYVAYLGAVSSVFADTAATEVGLLSKKYPRLITSLKKVPHGTPGGITGYGMVAQLISPASITLVLLPIFYPNHGAPFMVNVLAMTLTSSIAGSMVDSMVGASIQGVYKCGKCSKVTESKIHCGTKAVKLRGFSLVGNNLVNLTSALTGALVAVMLKFLSIVSV